MIEIRVFLNLRMFQVTFFHLLSLLSLGCTALDKTLGVRPPNTLTAEPPWVIALGAYLEKLFLVYGYSASFRWILRTFSMDFCRNCQKSQIFVDKLFLSATCRLSNFTTFSSKILSGEGGQF